jgi:hypothetical protein
VLNVFIVVSGEAGLHWVLHIASQIPFAFYSQVIVSPSYNEFPWDLIDINHLEDG